MPHPIEEKIEGLSRRARRLDAIYAASRWLATSVAALVALATVDWALGYHDRGLRWIHSFVALGAVAILAVYYFRPLARRRWSSLEVARRLQRRYPSLGDRLASSLEFLGQREDAPGAGSVELRRAVVSETEADVQWLDLSDALDRRPAIRAAVIALSAIGAIVAVGLFVPALVETSLARTAAPWSDRAWPSDNRLAFEPVVRRLALGEDFEATLIDLNGALPEEATIQYQFADDEPIVAEPMRRFGDRMIARRSGVRRDFQYRAFGGDDATMEWIAVEVVEPPRIASLTVRVVPPAYSGWPRHDSDPAIEALVGSRVELVGRASTPLSSAAVVLDNGKKIPAIVDADGYGFHLSPQGDEAWQIDDARAYWFELIDRSPQPLIGGASSRWQLRPVADQPPLVALEQPSGDLHVTPDGVVSLRAIVGDDLAVRRVDLVFKRTDRTDESESKIALWTGSDEPPAPPEKASFSSRQPMQLEPIDFEWSLSSVKLPPGVQVEFRVAAEDYRPNVGQSALARLIVVSAEQFERRLADRQAAILDQLVEALGLIRQSRGQIESIQVQLDRAGTMRTADVDQLRSARQNDRQATTILVDSEQSARAGVARLLEQFRDNRVENPVMQRRLSEMATQLDALETARLRPTDGALVAALALVETEPLDAPATVRRLAEAAEHQAASVAALEAMLGDLGLWDRFRRVRRDLADSLADELELTAQSEAAVAATLGKRPEDLTEQQRTDLARLAQRQRDLARSLEALQLRIEGLADDMRSSDRAAAESLDDAIGLARDRGVSAAMRRAADRLDENQAAMALDSQRSAADDLREMIDVAANRRDHRPEQASEGLRRAEKELEQARSAQEGLRKKMEAAEKESDPAERRRQLQRLAKRQREQQRRTEAIARQLRRLDARRAADRLAEGAKAMRSAADAAETGDKGADEALQAERRLEEAQADLAERRREAEAELLAQKFDDAKERIAGWIERQERLVGQTRDALKNNNGIALKEVAWAERLLHEETKQYLHELDDAEVLALALQQATEAMDRAAAPLESLDELGVDRGGSQSLEAQLEAIAALRQIVEALGGGGQAPDEAAAGDSSSNDGKAAAISEVKLLIAMQKEVNARTKEFDELRIKQGDLTEEQQARYDQLARRQGRVAELFKKLLQTSAAEQEPLEPLPDVLDEVERTDDGLIEPPRARDETEPNR